MQRATAAVIFVATHFALRNNISISISIRLINTCNIYTRVLKKIKNTTKK